MTYTFTIPGEPRVQKRHRDRKGGRGKYDPSAKDKESFLAQAMAQSRPDEPMEGELAIVVLCFGAKIRGDIDNYLKFVMDALAGPYYANDKQVRRATVGICESYNPRTWVSLSPSWGGPESP